jgi:hypothetical protein
MNCNENLAGRTLNGMTKCIYSKLALQELGPKLSAPLIYPTTLPLS